jgi:hypothetical protein
MDGPKRHRVRVTEASWRKQGHQPDGDKMTGEVNIKLTDYGVIEVEGLKITVAVVPSLVNPPTDRLFSFKRVGESMEVTQYTDAEGATKFFTNK